MKKTYRFLLVAVVTALAFTFSCSSDDSGDEQSSSSVGNNSSSSGGDASSSSGGGSSSSVGGQSSSSSSSVIAQPTLEGIWDASDPTRSITLSGDNWVYAEDGCSPCSKGTWSSYPAVVYGGGSGKLTLTLNEIFRNGIWVVLPPEYQTPEYQAVLDASIDATGNIMVTSNLVVETPGIFGTQTAGTFTRR